MADAAIAFGAGDFVEFGALCVGSPSCSLCHDIDSDGWYSHDAPATRVCIVKGEPLFTCDDCED